MFAAELLGAARHLGFDSMALAMDGLPVGTLMFEVLKHVGLLRQELACHPCCCCCCCFSAEDLFPTVGANDPKAEATLLKSALCHTGRSLRELN